MPRIRNQFKRQRIVKYRAAFVDDEGVFMDDQRFDTRAEAVERCEELNFAENKRTGNTPWFPVQTLLSVTQANF